MAAPNSSHARKNAPSVAHAQAQAPEPQRLGLPKYIPQKRESLPNPQEIQIRTLAVDSAPEPDHPQKNGLSPCKLPSWGRLLLKGKRSEWNSDSIQFPQKMQGIGFPIPFRDTPMSPSPPPLQQCHNWDFLPPTLITHLSISNSRYIFTKGLSQ